jgi:hypothetical protein
MASFYDFFDFDEVLNEDCVDECIEKEDDAMDDLIYDDEALMAELYNDPEYVSGISNAGTAEYDDD